MKQSENMKLKLGLNIQYTEKRPVFVPKVFDDVVE